MGHGSAGFDPAASQGHGGRSSSTPMYAFRAMDLNAATGWPQMPSYAAFINSGQPMHGMPPPFLIAGPSSSSGPMPRFLGPPGVPAPAFNYGVPSGTVGGEGKCSTVSRAPYLARHWILATLRQRQHTGGSNGTNPPPPTPSLSTFVRTPRMNNYVILYPATCVPVKLGRVPNLGKIEPIGMCSRQVSTAACIASS
jgi:hypothetical protein